MVVEGVADLVADHGADTAVIGGIVGRSVEERRLQDAGGKYDLVAAGAVIGVDRLRLGEPFVAVDLAAELGQPEIVHEAAPAHDVAGRSSRRTASPE